VFKGMDGLMKQAKDMQEKFERVQSEIVAAEVTGESGAGLVKVTMTGRHDVRRVEIDDSVLSEDKALLEDLLAAAVNDAVRRVEAHQRERMSELTGGLQMPAGFKFPFQA
jgi:DNA-binding YbaB/EbfC family protein